jgi:hypothetical protein
MLLGSPSSAQYGTPEAGRAELRQETRVQEHVQNFPLVCLEPGRGVVL